MPMTTSRDSPSVGLLESLAASFRRFVNRGAAALGPMMKLPGAWFHLDRRGCDVIMREESNSGPDEMEPEGGRRVNHDPQSATGVRDQRIEQLIERLPWRFRSPIRWLRQPSSLWIRLPAGVLLICGGLLGFLPVLGFWMLLLGLVLLAEDARPLKSAGAWILDWIERRYPNWLVAAPASPSRSDLRKDSR